MVLTWKQSLCSAFVEVDKLSHFFAALNATWLYKASHATRLAWEEMQTAFAHVSCGFDCDLKGGATTLAETSRERKF